MNKKVKTGLWAAVYLLLIIGVILAASAWHAWTGGETDGESIAENTEDTTISEESVMEEDPLEKEIDFDSLQKENADIYAYIEIPEAGVSVPIVNYEVSTAQSAEDTAAQEDVTQSAEEAAAQEDVTESTEEAAAQEEAVQTASEEAAADAKQKGVVYTENYNALTFEDQNTVIKGSSEDEDALFGGLLNYEDTTFFRVNPYVYIYLPGETRVYEIFAAVLFDEREIMTSYDFTDPLGEQAFIMDIFSMAGEHNHFWQECAVAAEDQLLTLSTPSTENLNSNWIVVAVLRDIEY